MKADVGFRLKELTDKRGVDSVIETSGSAAALQASLRGIGYGGIISYVAFAKPFPAGFNLGREAHFNNAKSSLLEHLVNQTQITQDGTVNESRTHVGNY